MKYIFLLIIFSFSKTFYAQFGSAMSVNSSSSTGKNIYTIGEIFVGSHSGIISIYNFISPSTISAEDIDYFDKINVYPNPTTGGFTISKNSGHPISKISLIDINGKYLYLNSQDRSQDISQLPDGIYFISIDDKKVIKILKQNKL
jgi:hypothetical protein